MSYTAPSGNAVNFQLSGVAYTAPAGNAVNFNFLQAYPATTLGVITQFGTPSHTYNFTGTATSLGELVQWGTTGGFFDQIQDADGFSPTSFGTPTARLTQGSPRKVIADDAFTSGAALTAPRSFSSEVISGSWDVPGSNVPVLSGGLLTPAVGTERIDLSATGFALTPYGEVELVVKVRARTPVGMTPAQRVEFGVASVTSGAWPAPYWDCYAVVDRRSDSGVTASSMEVYNDDFTVDETAAGPSASHPLYRNAELKTYRLRVTNTSAEVYIDDVLEMSVAQTLTPSLAPRTIYIGAVGHDIDSVELTNAAPSSSVYGTKFGTPQNLPNAVGFCPTAIGTPRTSLAQPATGWLATSFGTPEGHNHFNAATVGKLTKFAYWTGYTPVNQISAAYSFQPVEFGLASLSYDPALPAHTYGTASGFKVTKFGTPGYVHDAIGVATGFNVTSIGAPSVAPMALAGEVTGFSSTAYGRHAAKLTQPTETVGSLTSFGSPRLTTARRATGARHTAFGTPTTHLTQPASSVYRAPRWGTATVERSNTYKAYPTPRLTKFGRPKGFSRFNYPATGFCPTQFGTPASFETHRATMLPPIIRVGKPLLLRTPTC